MLITLFKSKNTNNHLHISVKTLRIGVKIGSLSKFLYDINENSFLETFVLLVFFTETSN